VPPVFGAIMVLTGPTVIVPRLRQAVLDRKAASEPEAGGYYRPVGARGAFTGFKNC